MRKILLTLFLVVGVSVSGVSQSIIADRDIDRYISYQLGSRISEVNPMQSDIVKSQLAERLNQKRTALKGVNHPAIGANIKQYTAHNSGSNGLSDVFVRFVEEDSYGNLYFSTYGMDRWNGYEWENFNPMNSGIGNATIHDMIEDRYGNFWLATFTGLVRIDGQSGDMRMIDVNQGLRSNLAYTLHESKDGKIYVGHRWNEQFGGGVSVLNYNGNVEHVFAGESGLHGDSVEDFAENSGTLYIATGADPNTGEWGGVTVYDLVGDSVVTAYHMDNSGLPYNETNRLAVDADGNLWVSFFTNAGIGHSEGGVVKFDGATWTHYSQDKGDNVGVDIRDLLVDSNGNLWIVSIQGVHKYDGTNFSKVEASIDEEIPMAYMSAGKELSDGRLAFSSYTSPDYNGGVYFYDPASGTWDYLSSSTDNGANSRIYFGADYDSKGNLWASGFYGLQKYDGTSWQTFTAGDGLLVTYGWDLIVDSNDNVWVNSSGEGLTRVNADGSIDTITEYGEFVESNYEAQNGDMWFGSWHDNQDANEDGKMEANGMLHYDGTNFTVYNFEDGLPEESPIVSIAEDQQGRILAATYDGLYRLDGGAFTKWEYDGYNNGAVRKLHLDSQDRLWINDGGRTAMFDGTNWEYFEQSDGIDGWVEDIEEDINGRIWLAQPDGAVVYDNGELHRVSPKNGIPLSGTVYDLAPSRTDAGTMTFALYGGGLAIMDTETPVTISNIFDNPDDEGGWIRVEVDGYLLSSQYTGEPADAWRVEINVDGNWEAASPVSPSSSRSVSVQVPVTKPTGVAANESNSFEFRVVAVEDEDGVVGISETITAYAEDNIAPAQVQSLAAEKSGEVISLNWNAVDANDLSGYAVFESSVTDFSGAEPLAFTSGLNVEIEDNSYEELVVVAKDRHNNFSSPATVVIGSTGIEQNAGLPDEFALRQNYPNPFNPVTKIAYALPQNSHAKITVFNALGQQVAVLLNEMKLAGNHEVSFNAGQLNSGMYFYRIEAAGFTQTRKMMLIK